MRIIELVKDIEAVKKSEIRNLIKKRIKDFKECGNGTCKEIFKELCFCILTANFNAERAIKIQNDLNDDFLILDYERLSNKLKDVGYRFPNTRAKYIIEARKYKESIKEIINSFQSREELRDWLTNNIKGLGYKEVSHLLRNLGFNDLAIIDFHIIDILVNYGFIQRPKTITQKKYKEIEEKLRTIGKIVNLDLAELDLYLWYLETNKVLK